MRFSDQIDLGNGALRSWQAEFERLLFDHSGRSQWGRREHGEMESHCFPPPPKSLLDHTLRCSIIQLVLARRNLVAQ